MSAAVQMPEKIKAEDVLLLDAPWSGGRTIEAYYGPVFAETSVPNAPRGSYPDRIAEAMDEIALRLQDAVACRGGNALVSRALELDSFAWGDTTHIRGNGSAFAVSEPKIVPQIGGWPCAPWL